jgi:hypothetical protein
MIYIDFHQQPGMGYFEILTNNLIPFARDTFDYNAVLVQDNAPTHRTAACRDILNDCRVIWVLLINFFISVQ